eukprot:scaffold386_cov281-Prasinococcus_capsulatus_cf.AAC.1
MWRRMRRTPCYREVGPNPAGLREQGRIQHRLVQARPGQPSASRRRCLESASRASHRAPSPRPAARSSSALRGRGEPTRRLRAVTPAAGGWAGGGATQRSHSIPLYNT